MSRLLPFLICGLTAPATFAQTDAPTTRTFDLTYVAEVRGIPAQAGQVDVWIPYPQSDEHQDILSVEVETPFAWDLFDEAEYGNRILHLRVDGRAVRSIPVTMRLQVARREHVQSLGGASAVPPTPDPRWLEPDRLVPLDRRIRSIATDVTADAGSPTEQARAIYDYVVDTMTYDNSGTGWGNGDIYWACDTRTGNCTDFHALFIGLNRSVGIPATFEIGFPLPPDRAAGQIEGYHCWAQFHLKGVGWVPVDTSEANKHPDQREYFFGAHDANRVLFSRGRDVTLAPPQQGPPLNYFIYPYVEVDGQPFDQVAHEFRFEDVTIESTRRAP